MPRPSATPASATIPRRSFYEAPLEASRQTRVISGNPRRGGRGTRGEKGGGTRYSHRNQRGRIHTAVERRRRAGRERANNANERENGGGLNREGERRGVSGRNPQVLDMRRATGGPLAVLSPQFRAEICHLRALKLLFNGRTTPKLSGRKKKVPPPRLSPSLFPFRDPSDRA